MVNSCEVLSFGESVYSVYRIFKCWSYTVLACGTLYVRVGTFDIQEEDGMLVTGLWLGVF